jgi:hypothetical protein
MVVTTTSTRVGDKLLKVVVAGLTTAGTLSSEVDMESEMLNACMIYGYPKSAVMQVARTAGTTDTVEVNLYGSNITTVMAVSTGGTGTTKILSCVSTTQSDPIGETDLDPYRYWQIVVKTQGAGNTLTATAVFQFGN